MGKNKVSKKGKLSAEDFDFFKKNIFKSDSELANILNRTEKFIQEVRRKVHPNKKSGKWTNSEVESLIKNKDEMSIEELSRLLNRQQKNIVLKLESLNEKQEEKIKHLERQDVKKEIVEIEEKIQHETSNSKEPISVKVEYICELCGNSECLCVKEVLCEKCKESFCICKEECCKDGKCQCKTTDLKKKNFIQKILSFIKFW